MRIAFYAPMKRPDFSLASGVERVGALLRAALMAAGHELIEPDLPLTYAREGNPAAQAHRRDVSLKAAEALIQAWRDKPQAPQAWVSYHVYYKSPDWIGPVVAAALAIPYLVVEGSHAPKRASGPFALGHAGAQAALSAARVLLASTAFDAECLAMVQGPGAQLIAFPPFIDPQPFAAARAMARPSCGPVAAFTAAMMNDPRKVESYVRLARAFAEVPVHEARLTIAGGGPHEDAVKAAFAGQAHVIFLGVQKPQAMPALFAAHDLFLWPGVGEAYGLVFLEAQAAGLPVVAQAHRGVPSVVLDGVSGLLTAPDDTAAYRAAILALVRDAPLRQALSQSARAFVVRERSVQAAARRLNEALRLAGVSP